ncbi:MAG: DUF4238 domain-containing protein [Gluconobacter potus]|uniref:DUF4238 domain-containing protein n=1 Tax=Gluconobacter potus TaxID=2724927 RepID=A0ABR9YP92_9PROT|nr:MULTISPECIES: DUF4238 domain-containing protein [Gluconobacter]MBF0865602.1 DUF4238 domain-containing protein [Gluconobacter sp. R71656]MBF0868614.1 DUF4238 domain-containing protein [Gluconobacter sp. R75628]MBF0874557.1 DUF4238 domain-containing protein [Gluconobacter sp. R75629]MBF0883632.1 DUF4238 domain-containing protein [Gluconobacter potus]
MNSPNPPVRHHYIPEFYLKNWCQRQEDNRLVEYKRPGPGQPVHSAFKYPKQVGFEKDLYTIPEFDPDLRTWIEDQFMGQVDSYAAQIQQVMIQGKSTLSHEDQVHWARFMISLIHRNPEKVDFLRNSWKKIYSEGQNAFRPPLPEGLRDISEDIYTKMEAGEFVRLFTRIIDNEKVGTTLLNMSWHVLDIHKGDLLTSDRPIFRSKSLTEKHAFMALSLNPKRLLLLVNRRNTFDKIISHWDKIASDYNNAIVRQSCNYVYGSHINHKRFIENRLGYGSPQFIGGSH